MSGAAAIIQAFTTAMIDGWANTEKAVRRGEAMRLDQKERHEKILKQMDYETQNLGNNFNKTKAMEIKNAMRIESNKLEAEDAMSRSMAGSGLSGTTLNEIDAQISTKVAESHQQNKAQSRATSRESYLGLRRSFNESKAIVDNEVIFNGTLETNNAALATSAAAIEAGANTYIKGMKGGGGAGGNSGGGMDFSSMFGGSKGGN